MVSVGNVFWGMMGLDEVVGVGPGELMMVLWRTHGHGGRKCFLPILLFESSNNPS